MDISTRLDKIRGLMSKKGIDAYIITGTDPHLSEYTPSRWKTREWISNFSGSAGKVLITKDKALLWTDFRYFIQAAEELEGSEIILMKDRTYGSPTMEEWIIKNISSKSLVATDGSTISLAQKKFFEQKLRANGLSFSIEHDLVSEIWRNRPIEKILPAYDFELKYSGRSRTEKIKLVRQELVSDGNEATIIAALDDIAWLLNIRGEDIDYTPLVTSYCLLDQNQVTLFINPLKLGESLMKSLEKDHIIILEYASFFDELHAYSDKKIAIDYARTNARIYNLLNQANSISNALSIPTRLKSVKNETEIDGIKKAYRRDGAAIIKSLYWIEENAHKQELTELKIAHKVTEYRSQLELYRGESFAPIVGFNFHGAIVHYKATVSSDLKIDRDGILLIDSGGQFLDGTTDMTRTILLGNATKKQKEDFTICLKAHINLANAVFPKGTTGNSLDAITRKPLWNKGLNYGHGTGHGIGHFLCVHEGPMSIRQEANSEVIVAGNLLSDEPGIYRTGEYGIRIENVLLCKEIFENEFGSFLGFETVSLCPIDAKLIEISLLTSEEIKWINEYHRKVLSELSPLIEDELILNWLYKQCLPLKSYD